jgi:DNA topoisomerase-1
MVADELGNTPAVARKGYIHPAVIAAYLAGRLEAISDKDDGADPYQLSAEEKGLLALLSAQATSPASERRSAGTAK